MSSTYIKVYAAISQDKGQKQADLQGIRNLQELTSDLFYLRGWVWTDDLIMVEACFALIVGDDW